MLDRFFRRLGYVPASSHQLVSATSEGPPHRRGAERFHFVRAKSDALCSWYVEGDDVRHAVGRDNFAPLAVVGLSLTCVARSHEWLDESLRCRASVGDDVLHSWRRANRSVLRDLGQRLDERVSFPKHLIPRTGNEERDVVPYICAAEMAEVFALSWQRAHLASPFAVLSGSAPYLTLRKHHVFRLVHQTNDHALERVLSWLAIWLEIRGLAVDRAGQVVEIPGYQALFHRSSSVF